MKGVSKLSKGNASPSMLVQGLIYFLGGLWPIVHYRSFSQYATPKAEPKLVKGFGAIMWLSGLVLISAGLRAKGRPDQKLALTGSSMAVVTTLLEVMGGFKGKLSTLTLATAALDTIDAGLRETDERRAAEDADFEDEATAEPEPAELP